MNQQKSELSRHILSGNSSVTSSARVLGIERATIYRWINRFKKNKAIPRFHSSRVGRPPSIDLESGKKLLKIMKQPASQFGQESDFWTRQRIIQVAKKNLGLNLSKTSILRFLVRCGQSYKKPERRYYEKNNQEQKRWQKHEVPKIKA